MRANISRPSHRSNAHEFVNICTRWCSAFPPKRTRQVASKWYWVPTLFHVQPEIPVCCRAALELVGDQYARRATVLPEQLEHESPGCVPVAPALHQHVEHRPVPVHRTPQPVLPAVDGDHHFLEMPLVAPVQRGRRMRRAMPKPNFTDQRRTVSKVRRC